MNAGNCYGLEGSKCQGPSTQPAMLLGGGGTYKGQDLLAGSYITGGVALQG